MKLFRNKNHLTADEEHEARPEAASEIVRLKALLAHHRVISE
jgi:hypothetical protein